MIIIKIKDSGEIKLKLDAESAPKTVAHFEELVNDSFYDGLIFHRVINGFMIQGGCPQGTGMGGPGHCVDGEFAANGIDNQLKHNRGTISMARSADHNSAGSQFFIVHEDAPHLDGQYAAFGVVVEGIEIVDQIAETQTDYSDRPLEDIVIERIYIQD